MVSHNATETGIQGVGGEDDCDGGSPCHASPPQVALGHDCVMSGDHRPAGGA